MLENDQKQMWDKKHEAGEHAQWKDEPRTFARDILEDLKSHTSLLELGCGVGSDARFFADHAINVVATDFSPVVIAQNEAITYPSNLQFRTLDILQPYPFAGESFDAVYAHLALHYYTNADTKKVFAEIHRVLKPGGMLYFNCKSTHDSKYGEGTQIEPDVFSRHGHIRHFFSPEYTKQVLGEQYEVIRLDETSETYAGDSSAFVNCWARKHATA